MRNLHRIVLTIVAGGLVCVAAVVAHAQAPAGRFVVGVDHQPGGASSAGIAVVFDKKTGLTWQQGFTGPVTLPFLVEFPADYCADLAYQSGSVGWRLPAVKELLTLVDYAGSSRPETEALIDATYFPNTPAAGFLSATSSAATPVQCVDFTQGWLRCPETNYFRCVR